MKKLILICLFALVSYPAMSQTPVPAPGTPINISVGFDTYTVPSANLGLIVGGGNLRSRTVADFRPTGVFGQFAYSFRTGAEYTFAESAKYELHAIGTAGIAVQPTMLGSMFAGGAGVQIKTTKLWGWRPVIDGEATAGTAAGTTSIAINVSFRSPSLTTTQQ